MTANTKQVTLMQQCKYNQPHASLLPNDGMKCTDSVSKHLSQNLTLQHAAGAELWSIFCVLGVGALGQRY